MPALYLLCSKSKVDALRGFAQQQTSGVVVAVLPGKVEGEGDRINGIN